MNINRTRKNALPYKYQNMSGMQIIIKEQAKNNMWTTSSKAKNNQFVKKQDV